MKPSIKSKLIKCLDKLQDQIKGGPGSGPRPGGGGHSASASAVNASNAAVKYTGARNQQLRDLSKRAVALANAAHSAAKSGNMKDAKKYHELAAKHHKFIVQSLNERQAGVFRNYKDDAKRGQATKMHEDAQRMHEEAASAF